MEAAAKKSANSIGLTTDQFLDLAASQQQVLTSLGLTSDQTTELIPDLLEMSYGLSQMSGGKVSTAEAADILTKSLQGETEELKRLGIPMKFVQDDLKRLSTELQKNEGYTKKQADAIAGSRLVLEQVGAAVEEFTGGQKTMAQQIEESDTKLLQSKIELAKNLNGFFLVVTKVGTGVVDILSQVVLGFGDMARDLGALPSKFTDVAAAFIQMSGFASDGMKEWANSYVNLKKEQEEQARITALEAGGIDVIVTAQTIKAASTEKLKQKYQELLKAQKEAAEQGNKRSDLLKSSADLLAEADLIDATVQAREKEEEETKKLGKSYNQLQQELTDLADARKLLRESEKEAIADNNAQVAAVEASLKVFEKTKDKEVKKLSETQQAYQRYKETQKDISIAYELGTAKIASAVEERFLTEEQAQQMLLELEVSTASARLAAKEQLATADKKITQEEQENILTLNSAMEKAKVALDAYTKSIEDGVKDRDVTIKINLELAETDLNKTVADAISFNDLSVAFDETFSSVATNLGEGVREELLKAAKDGTIDFQVLADAGASEEQLAAFRKEYEEFALETKRNSIQLVKDQDEIKLRQLTESLGELNTKFQTLVAERDRKIKFGIEVPQADQDEIVALENQIKTLKGEVVDVSVNVNVDAEALKKAQEALDKAREDNKPSSESKSGKAALAEILGMEEKDFDLAVQAAGELIGLISSTILEGQRRQIEQATKMNTEAANDQFDSSVKELDRRLEQGNLTQQEYDRQKLVAEETLDKKKYEIERTAFERMKRLKKTEITLNFASELAGIGVASTSAGPGMLALYAILAGVAAAKYAVNISTVTQQQFAKGGIIYGDGGQTRSTDISRGTILRGPSHDQGGITTVVGKSHQVELEGDEIVINKRSSRMFAPLLSQINSYQGWGKAFASGGVIPSDFSSNWTSNEQVANSMANNSFISSTNQDNRSSTNNTSNNSSSNSTSNNNTSNRNNTSNTSNRTINNRTMTAMELVHRYATSNVIDRSKKYAHGGIVNGGDTYNSNVSNQGDLSNLVNNAGDTKYTQGGNVSNQVNNANTKYAAGGIINGGDTYHSSQVNQGDKYASGGIIHGGSSSHASTTKYAHGGIVNGTNYISNESSIVSISQFERGGIVDTPQFARGGIIPPVFAQGGNVSLVPSFDTIANNAQLAASTQQQSGRPISLNGEREQNTTVLYISELESKQKRMSKTVNRVSYGG